MRERLRRSVIATVIAIAAAVLFAPVAGASITPTLTLDQSAGDTAGAAANLGMDLKFSYTGSDSPDQMAIQLPPGLLADASIDGGKCLQTADLTDTACQVGTGTVTGDALSLVPLPVAVTFDLVPPPAPGDLAGLAVNDGGTQIGDTAAITVRPSGSTDGVGITINFTLPDSLDGVPISITEINSTFDGLRYPTTCPATPANVGVSVNSYDDATYQTVAQPLDVTGCSSLPYAPKLSVTAAKDSADDQVRLSTGFTQAADESPSQSMQLGFPGQTLGVNLFAIKLLCLKLSSSCTPVGSATATSPDYPAALTGSAYLTGTSFGPTLTIQFPSPFPLTLVGNVSLITKTASFSGLPDIPLTALSLTLNGGTYGMFDSACAHGYEPTSSLGTVTAALADQNGDKKANLSTGYKISGCPASSASISPTAALGAGVDGRPSISRFKVTKLNTGSPALSFRIAVRRGASPLTQLKLALSGGFAFVQRRVGKRELVRGVTVSGGKVKSLKVVHGDLVITLRGSSSNLSVKVVKSLRESSSLMAKARKGKIGSLSLTVNANDSLHRSYKVTSKIKHPGK